MKQGKRRLRFWKIFLLCLLVAGICFGGKWAMEEWGLFDSRIAVALDAGHGGNDPGAEGLIGETQLTETTVRYLEEYLRQDENYRVILCREYGESKDINDRWRLADRKGAELLLCIHGNSSEDPSARGFEAYPPPPGRKYHEEALSFARLLAGEISQTGIPLRGDGGVRYAYYQGNEKILTDNPDPELESLPSFGMVDYPDCPAVLAEQCFLTNQEDVALLGTEEGCQQAALCYYRAICAYFGTEPLL